MDDADLIRSIRTGDVAPMGALIERHYAPVHRLCRRIAGNAADAEALAHDTFVEAWLKLDQLRDAEKFAPWLRTLALNLCRMWYRSRQRQPSELTHDPPAAEEPAEFAPRGDVLAGLSRLSADHRVVIVLHYWEGLSYEQIAQFLDLPIGTVMSRLHRARQRFKDIIEQPQHEETPHVAEEQFKREVEAEIATLASIAADDRHARERLSVILSHSPERFARLIADAADETALENLSLLLRHLGRPGLAAVLDAYWSSEPRLHGSAATILERFVARPRPSAADPLANNVPDISLYLLLDELIAGPASDAAKARCLLDLMTQAGDERNALLLMGALLSYRRAATPLLLSRFWEVRSADEVYQQEMVLHALCRLGSVFARAIAEAIRQGETPRLRVALAGAEALARSGSQAMHARWFDINDDRRLAIEGRFRLRWVPPLLKDRDATAMRDLGEALAALLASDRADLREPAIRALGLMGDPSYLPRIRAILKHRDGSTRIAALRALGDSADVESASMLIEIARTGDEAEQRIAVEILGQLGIAAAQPILIDLARQGSRVLRRAAILALGEIGTPESKAALQEFMRSPDRDVVKTAASALYGGTFRRSAPPKADRPPTAGDRMRGGAQPVAYLALDMALRALPCAGPFDEPELTRHIAQICWDYAGARRGLVEAGLLARSEGVYELTELGQAAWRVERFIAERYAQ